MASNPLSRERILPEVSLPDPAQLIEAGRRLGAQVQRGGCAFLDLHGVSCELEYKRRTVSEGRVMFQAQVGYRDIDKTERACLEIHERLARNGYVVDRFGLIFDRSMGYPSAVRAQRPQGTGLIVGQPRRFSSAVALCEASSAGAVSFGITSPGEPNACTSPSRSTSTLST